ncbi:MAG: Vitamin B12 dependent methionine synthase activation subunit, partial [Lachnospiraceae bacterium]|nr:Vitamin B12 dependent methionine synthase activation subunit [Lachnospiraceae bacterium]
SAEEAAVSAEEAAAEGDAPAPQSLLRFGGMEVRSKGLARNLAGCREVCLLAATIGPGVDLLIRRAQVSAMSRAVIFQAAGAAMIEAYVDGLNEQIRQEARARGLFLRPRFSPGYGDFSLEHQTDFARVLEMQKTCGITLGSSLLMTPSKSVTAVIGLSGHGTDCREPGCEECTHPCEYRRV